MCRIYSEQLPGPASLSRVALDHRSRRQRFGRRAGTPPVQYGHDRPKTHSIPKLITMSIRAFAILFSSVAVTACATAAPTALTPRASPHLDRIASEAGARLGEEVRPASAELLGPVTYDLPVEANSWVETELNFLMTERRDVVERWMERGDFYKEFVRQVLREHGVPTDLYHLALIESGFQPTARSSAGAVGVWQFMPATGKELGLRIESGMDERMDPIRSTRAAARHLRSLYRVHGDWALAAAAYNAGSGRISRGLERFAVANFWDLAQQGDLAEETRHYVPRLFAVTIIHRNRERLGLIGGSTLSPFAFDSVQVDYETPLEVLAEISATPADELARLNPHLTGGSAPAGGYWVWVPAGTGVSTQERYLASDFRRDQGVANYVVRWGDSLGRIAQRSGLAASRVRQLNPSVDFDRLMAGATIKLPANAVRKIVAAAEAAVSEGDTGGERTPAVLASADLPGGGSGAAKKGASHTVRAGDTLWDIARVFGVSIEDIQGENGLAGEVIRAGQELRIPAGGVDAGGSQSKAASVDHVVRAGDTLSEIAEAYGSSVGAIQSANGLETPSIRAGQVLTVPL